MVRVGTTRISILPARRFYRSESQSGLHTWRSVRATSVHDRGTSPFSGRADISRAERNMARSPTGQLLHQPKGHPGLHADGPATWGGDWPRSIEPVAGGGFYRSLVELRHL